MIRALGVALLSLFALNARAHVGSPDLFYSGSIGEYPARVTIRMPGVIPGRAEISVRVETGEPVEVSFLPLYARTAIKNAPPPDIGRLVQGETNLYTGELWLMSFGAYSVEVRVQGAKGSGNVQIPLTSVASRQLPMPSFLGKVLSALALTLLVGGIGIAAAAGREATLASGQTAGKPERRSGFIAALVTLGILVGAVVGGRHWWSVEESSFRLHLREGAWPDLGAKVKMTGTQTILQLEVGKNAFASDYKPSLIPDHGKLMHLFLIREGSLDAFAHLHPVRKKGYTFEVALPPLPEGRYTVFTDLTFEGGSSSTATAAVTLPAVAPTGSVVSSTLPFQSDPDDSWSAYPNEAVPPADASAPLFHCADGTAVTWTAQKPLRLKRDASLRFEIADSSGRPLALEPYMGMLCHAAVLRSDGSVFAHLHPMGNYSMAAQSFFADKLAREVVSNSPPGDSASAPMDHSMHQGHLEAAQAVSSVYLPYEFPESGDYRIWVQLKSNGRVYTAAFDAKVAP